jgi:hypothetical protein
LATGRQQEDANEDLVHAGKLSLCRTIKKGPPATDGPS